MIDVPWGDSLTRWTRGNVAAADLVRSLWQIVELWDDLIDKDAEILDADINAAMYAALITLPRNQFYMQNFQQLNILIEAAIIDWFTANNFERSKSESALRQSYVLRCSLVKVIVAIARIIGGIDLAVTVSSEIHLLGDTWAEYALNHGVQ